MRPSSIAIIAIWFVFLADALRQGIRLPTSTISQPAFPVESAMLMLSFPFVFFLIAAFFQRHKKFSAPVISRVIDAKFGAGTFEDFVVRLQPTALFMCGTLLLGSSGLICTYLTTQNSAAYIFSGFFLSAGLGLAGAYILSFIFPPRLP